MRDRVAMKRFDEMAYADCEWLAVYFNNIDKRVVEITRGANRFSKCDYNNLIQSMFIDACGGWECRDLSTLVLNRSGKLFCSIHMITFHDGSEIWADVYVNGQRARTMLISQ